MRTLALLVFAASAHAAPVTMTFSGRLLSSDGSGENGNKDLVVTIYDSTGQKWTDDFDAVPVSDGYFALVLGSQLTLQSSVFDGTGLEVGVGLQGEDELIRQDLTHAPLAVRADTVRGTVQVGGDGACATAADDGTLRFSGGKLEVCANANWAEVVVVGPGSGTQQNFAGLTCNSIHTGYPTLQTGTYWIDPDGDTDHSDAYQVHCDMETDGGGWTRCLSAKYWTGTKPTGWTKENWISASWGDTLLDNVYTGSNYGNLCPQIASASTEISGEVTYNPASGWTDFRTGPIPLNAQVFATNGNGTWTAANGHSIGRDSDQTGVENASCSNQYTGNTARGMESICFEDNTHWQAQHTGWNLNQYTYCADAPNQPCYCTQNSYCGGSDPYEQNIVMTVYLR